MGTTVARKTSSRSVSGTGTGTLAEAGEPRRARRVDAKPVAPKKLDVFVPVPDERDFFGDVRKRPKDPKVVLEALSNTEEVLRDVSPVLLKDFAFLKKAVLANPFVLLNEGANDWMKKEILKIFPQSMRKKLLADPEVAAAIAQTHAALARVPDLNPANFTLDRAFFREVLANRLNPGADDPRPLAVVLYPHDDWNGEFHHLQPELSAHHRLMFYRVSTDAEAAKSIAEATQNKPATLVVLGGHGAQRLMAFGADDPARMSPAMQARRDELMKTEAGRTKLDAEMTRTNEDRYFDFTDADILKPLADRIAPGAELVLFSCSTGQGGKDAKNLANFMHGIFPHAHVVAPTEPVPNNGLLFDDKGAYQKPSFENVGTAYRIPAGGTPPLRAHALRARGG